MTLNASATALLTRVRAYNSGATFTTLNSAFGDWNVLAAPGVEVSAVVWVAEASRAGPMVDEYGAYGEQQEVHSLAVTIASKRGVGDGGDSALEGSLTALTDALRAYLATWPRLNLPATVREARIVGTTAPYEIAPALPEDAPSTHRAQDIRLEVACFFTVTYAEAQ